MMASGKIKTHPSPFAEQSVAYSAVWKWVEKGKTDLFNLPRDIWPSWKLMLFLKITFVV